MNDTIRPASQARRTGKKAAAPPAVLPQRRLVPVEVGSATVWIEQVAEPAAVDEGDRVRPVSAPSPEKAFETAGEILRECVRLVGERVANLAEKSRPQEVSVEFSLTFEVKGKAAVIPVFVTGETAAQTGLKVSAVWKRSE